VSYNRFLGEIMALVLFITTENEETIEYPILGKCTLGRSSSCDLTLKDSQLSGKHGSFELSSKGELIYTDLGSTNGSYLNNSLIQKVQFKINESLRLGNTIITIDAKRLNSREIQAIGKGQSASNQNTIIIPSPKPKIAEKSVIKKALGIKNQKVEISVGRNDTLLEQEPSSGETKMLKLDINKHKKK
jgi:pSer/pThr/pTyr-binding forkhead associated (FHA) protein